MQFNHSTTSFRNGIGRWMGTAGVVLPPGLSNQEILHRSGTMFEVEKREIAVETPTGYAKSPKFFATVRTDNDTILGTVGKKYKITQNSAALQLIEAAGDRLEVHAAGAMDEGAKCWFYCAVKGTENEIVKGDPQSAYVLLTSDHSGNGSMEVSFTSVRLVCVNQMNMLRKESRKKGNNIKIRHSGNIDQKLRQAERVVGKSLQLNTPFQEEMKYLAALPITENETEVLLRQLVPNPPRGTNPTMAKNKRAEMKEHIVTGRGQDMEGVRGTRYGVLQGITHWATWKHEGHKDQETKLKHAWFSTGDATAQKARELLLASHVMEG